MIFSLLTGAVRILTLLMSCWRARRRSASIRVVFALAVAAAHGGALADTFNGGAISNCNYDAGSKTYTCSALNSADTATFTIASGYTVIVTGQVNFAYNQQLSMSGTASLQSSNSSINLTNINPASLNISGGTLKANTSLAVGIKAITADLSADSLTTVSNSKITGSVTVTNAIALNSSTTIVGAVSAGSLSAGSSLNVTGQVSVKGPVQLESASTINGALSGSIITTGSGSSFTGNVTATSSFSLASGGKLVGNINAPVVAILASPTTVTGNIVAATSLKLESGSTVNGNVSGGSLQMDPSPVVINGNATMSGDVDIGSGDTINGDLTARNVMTRDSNAYISGNAIVNAITLNYAAKVGKTIYCTAPGATGCSCVTNNSGYGMPAPTCAAGQPPAAGPDHIQISHSGSALTCQPQTVTLTACANASCTAPHYSAATTVTLQPGGKQFTISNGINSAATVERGTAGTAVLSSSSHAYTCINSGDPSHPCDMTFKTSGLTVSAPNHVSMSGATLTIQAMTASANNQSCVPLVSNKTVGIDMACTYNNPTTGTVQPKVASTNLSCGGGTTSVSFSFNAGGVATAALEYADVGKLDLKATYAATGGGTAFSADGAGSFIAAPKEFVIVATSAITGVNTATTHDIFAKASEAFTVKVSAVNAQGNVTKNFGRESVPENVTFLQPTVDNPTGAGNNGVISPGQFNAFNNGVSDSKSGSAGQWSFSDVGAIKLSAKLANSSAFYMGYAALPGFATTGMLVIGRFVPDHFDTVLMTDAEIAALAPTQPGGRTMSCAGLAVGVNPCTGTSTRFTHSRQPFFVKVLAYNGASPPALTSNYAGSLSKPITTSIWTAVGGASAATGGVFDWSGTDPQFSFAAGTGMPASPGPLSANLPRFTFTSAYPASNVLPTTIYLRAIDTDNVSSKRSVGADSVEAPLTVVSGRLYVANAYGSQNSPLPIEASAQYYMPSGYVFNSQVNAASTTTIASKIAFSSCQKALDVSGNGGQVCPGATSLKAANTSDVLTLVNGKGTFRMAAPTPTLTGIGSTNVSLGSMFDYLPSSLGRATFGIYRSGPVIYTREVHN
jgi:MSHA biogenesis protein MshQ